MNIIKKYHLSVLMVAAVFLIGFSLRFYKLSDIPPGLYADETALGYNAYSILLTGRDEYGEKLPLYFRSFDDYKLPVYVYSTALTIKLFGANAFAVRLPSALFGSLSVIALYFLILELSGRKRLALLTSLFLALNPWHIFFSRAGYEVNMATSLIVIGTLFFIMAVNRKNNLLLFILSATAFLLSLYTYNVTRLIAPIIFISLVALYYRKIISVSRKTISIVLLLFFAGMLPFLITFFTLQSQSGFSSQKDALIMGNAVKADILLTKSYFISLPEVLQKTVFNSELLIG
ncbi:MAG: glycosyltransferase family 39 protein [Actinobacteria bacterium]|nr:glycosyltransferase family 39 protein [Actinomycetota bacterium]